MPSSFHPSIHRCTAAAAAADEMVFDRSSNLSGIPKLFLLKFSVTLIVAQGLVANILVTTHTGEQIDDGSDDGDDSEDGDDDVVIVVGI